MPCVNVACLLYLRTTINCQFGILCINTNLLFPGNRPPVHISTWLAPSAWQPLQFAGRNQRWACRAERDWWLHGICQASERGPGGIILQGTITEIPRKRVETSDPKGISVSLEWWEKKLACIWCRWGLATILKQRQTVQLITTTSTSFDGVVSL